MLRNIKYGSRELLSAKEIIAIGDIHGENKKLLDLLDKVKLYLNNKNLHLIFCGDYCDRGPESIQVLETLIGLRNTYKKQVFFIRGNHEEMLISTLMGYTTWSYYTDITLKSMRDYWRMPKASLNDLVEECSKRGILSFLNELIPYYESEYYICTHAPIKPEYCYNLDKYNNDFLKGANTYFLLEKMGSSLQWEFTSENPKNSKIKNMTKHIICGHQFKHHSRPRIMKHRSFIDVGCGAHPNKPLVAVKYPEKKVLQSFKRSKV